MKWIPMEWMTPDKTGAYLVTRKGGSPSVVIGHWEQPQGQLSFESDNKGRWKWMPQEIIAWMPLPEPFTADTPQTDWHYDEQDSTWYPYKHEDEPQQKSCATCKHALCNWDGESNNCGRCCGADRRFYKPKTESQTERSE